MPSSVEDMRVDFKIERLVDGRMFDKNNPLFRSSRTFLTSDQWFRNYVKVFSEGRVFYSLTGYMDGEAVSFVLLGHGFKETYFRLIPINYLVMNIAGDEEGRSPYIEYNEVIVDKDHDTPEYFDKLLYFLLNNSGMKFDVLEIPYVLKNSNLYGAILRNRLGVEIQEVRESRSYYVDLSFFRSHNDNYMTSRSKKTRDNIRQNLTRYSQLGNLSLEVAASVDEAIKMFTLLEHYHTEHWEEKGEGGVFRNKKFVEFHQQLIRDLFISGSISLFQLNCGSVPVGLLYGFKYNNTFYFYQSGFNYKDFEERLSPGITTLYKALEYYADTGIEVFNFLAGDVDYKRRLSTGYDELVWLKLWKKNFKRNSITFVQDIRNRVAALAR